MGKHPDYNEIKRYINLEEIGNGCKLITTKEDFIKIKKEQNKTNSYVKIRIQCKCGNLFITDFIGFKHGKNKCDKCGRLTNPVTQRKTHIQFIKEVEDKFGIGEYIFLEKYNGKDNPILTRHKCGFEWNISPNNLLRADDIRCPQCSNNIKSIKMTKTHEEFLSEVFQLVGDEYTFLEEYKGSEIKIKIRHNCESCNNYEWKIQPNNFLNGQRCAKCQRPNYDRDTNKFKQEVFELVGNEYSILGEYTRADEKILLQHNCDKCNNHIYKVNPCDFLNGGRCPVCASNKINDYDILNTYKNAKTYLQVRHKKCGTIYNVIPNSFKKYDCPFCNESKGEEQVKLVLEKYNHNYSREYRFQDCRNKRTLPFDFYLPNYNFLIEYQGIQHYEPVEHFGGQEQFEKQQFKREYCKQNNINLLAIPYWDFQNIEKIIVNNIHTSIMEVI